MCSLTDKFLAVILALFMGFSPLQGAVAAVPDAPTQEVGMHQMHQLMAQQDEMNNVTPPQMNHDCQRHLGDERCTNHAGSAGHCTGCAVGILPVITTSSTPAVETLALRPSTDGFTSQHAPSLYRPPRY